MSADIITNCSSDSTDIILGDTTTPTVDDATPTDDDDVNVNIDTTFIDTLSSDTSTGASTTQQRKKKKPLLLQLKSCSSTNWPQQRIQFAISGSICSVLVCTIRLLLDPSPSAYIIHSIIVLFDMILIHIFAHTPWLSISGEITTVIFATCFHITNQKIFELLETTIIALLVSVHMIKQRDKHWDREHDLEKDVIGLQLYIEHHYAATNEEDDDVDDNGDYVEGKMNASVVAAASRRRRSSLLSVGRSRSSISDIVGDIETGSGICSDIMSISRRTIEHRRDDDGESCANCWSHFFDHFLDGSAGVLYTSFVGLIIDEIVNLYW